MTEWWDGDGLSGGGPACVAKWNTGGASFVSEVLPPGFGHNSGWVISDFDGDSRLDFYWELSNPDFKNVVLWNR